MGLARTVFDAAIGWTVQSILGSFFTGQRQDVAATLQPEMKSTQMVLAAAEGRRIDSRLLSELLKELFYGTEVVMDELNYYQFQKLIEGCIAAASINPEGSGVSSYCPSFFQGVSSSMNQITNWAIHGKKREREEEPTHNIMVPLEIRNVISERINGIVNRLPIRGKSVQDVIGHNMASKHTRANSRRQTTSIPTEHDVYGRDAEWQTIVELLIKGKSTALGVLSLVGVGGIGKTTLAQIVYHDQRIKDHFDLQMWICVSFGFNEQRLTIQMLDHVCEGRQGYKSFDVLQKKLLEKIRHKRFLLVLDDMWEDTNMRGWKNLLAPLTCNEATGCMILVTTRMTSVGKMVGTMSNVEVNGMDEPSFWEFFKSLAFRGTENQELDPSLVSIGKHIAKSLKGHPLAAKSIGGILNDSVCLEHYSPSLHSSPPMLTPGDKYTFNGPPRQVPQVPEEISEALHRNAKRAKKRKANPIVDDFHERYLSLKMEERDRIAAIKEKSEDPYCINKCIKTLENLQGLSMGDVLEAADIFTNNKTNRETFLSFSSDELRLGWLVRQIHHT